VIEALAQVDYFGRAGLNAEAAAFALIVIHPQQAPVVLYRIAQIDALPAL
jgi:hypothetical protein